MSGDDEISSEQLAQLRRARRILIIGCSGSGKSTLARLLSTELTLPVVHIDQLFWTPGWIQADQKHFEAGIRAAIAEDAWVIDGNSSRTLIQRLSRADLLIWLKLPRWLCLWRVILRVAGSLGVVRPDMAPGCPEKWDWEFLKYIWYFDRDQTPRLVEALEHAPCRVPTIELTNSRQVRALVDGLCRG